MINNFTIIVFPLFLGINIVLQGHFLKLQMFLFFMLFLLDVVDAYTRFRVEKRRMNFQSKLWRAGLSQKVNDYITVGVASLLIYASLGSVNNISEIVSLIFSAIPLTLTAGYIIGSVSSILENNIEYFKLVGIKPRETTLFFVKILGIAQGKLFKNLIKKLDEKDSK